MITCVVVASKSGVIYSGTVCARLSRHLPTLDLTHFDIQNKYACFWASSTYQVLYRVVTLELLNLYFQ